MSLLSQDDDPYLLMAGGATSSNILDCFGYLEFLQIIIFGDKRVAFSLVPGSATAGFRDSLLFYHGDAEHSRSLTGDPIKNTMLMHTARRLPILAAIPVLLTLFLFAADVLIIGAHKLTILLPHLFDDKEGNDDKGSPDVAGPHPGLKGIESEQFQKVISGANGNSLQSFSKNKIIGEMPSNSFINLGGINGAQTMVQVNGGQSASDNSFINLGGINGAQTMVQVSESSLKSSSSSGISKTSSPDSQGSSMTAAEVLKNDEVQQKQLFKSYFN